MKRLIIICWYLIINYNLDRFSLQVKCQLENSLRRILLICEDLLDPLRELCKRSGSS
jgi:hypothetical protein